MSSADGQTGQGKVAYRRLFANKNFTALWLGQMISFVGDYFYWLAVPIMVERLTGSALMVGLSVITTALPMLFLGPVAGVFVDRWDRKRTMIAADVLRALLVLPCLLVRTPDQVWIYYVVGFLMSCVSRFFFPAQNASLPLIVKDRSDLLAANGLMQTIQTAGLLAGPALAGFAIGLWGEQVAFIVDSASFLVSAGAILTMTVPRTTLGKQVLGGQVGTVWAEMREGVTYLFGNRTMVGVLVCMAVVQLGLGAINVLWVPFLQRTFGVDATGLGIVDSAQGAGMVLSGLALGFVASRLNRTAMAGWAIILIGLFIAAMGLAPAFGYVIVLSFAVGLPLIPAQSALVTMMQLAVPDLKRGRVGSAMNALTMAAGLVSMGVASAFSEAVGLRAMYAIAGLITLSAGVVGLFVLKEPETVVEERLRDESLERREVAEAVGD